MRRITLFAVLTLAACASGTPRVHGRYGLQLDNNSAEAIASNEGAEDLEVTLRAAFASRFEDIDFAPQLTARDEYDAIVFVRVNWQVSAGYGQRRRIGLEYEVSDAAGTVATGFVPINLPEWPPRNTPSDRVYSALSSASEEFAMRVAAIFAKMPKRNPPRPIERPGISVNMSNGTR